MRSARCREGVCLLQQVPGSESWVDLDELPKASASHGPVALRGELVPIDTLKEEYAFWYVAQVEVLAITRQSRNHLAAVAQPFSGRRAFRWRQADDAVRVLLCARRQAVRRERSGAADLSYAAGAAAHQADVAHAQAHHLRGRARRQVRGRYTRALLQ